MYRITTASKCCLIYLLFLEFTIANTQNCTFNGWKNGLADPTTCCIIPKGVKTDGHPNIERCFDNENGTECEIMNCIFKEQNFLTVNGTLNMNEISKDILYGKPQQWTIPAKESMKFCSTKAEGKPCAELVFADCLFQALFVNCPEMFWHESETCQTTKVFVKKCLLER